VEIKTSCVVLDKLREITAFRFKGRLFAEQWLENCKYFGSTQWSSCFKTGFSVSGL